MNKCVNEAVAVAASFLLFNAEAEVVIREGTVDLPSYEISAPEKSAIFDCRWSYQRARRSIYPYPLNDNLRAEKSKVKTWKALYLENEYLKLCVLPEIGGRLFSALDKTSGYDIFYRQDAIKPANVGMNGAWISGGVEWNVFHHHRISTQMPCDWRLVENADGSKSIWLGETERRHRMSWAVGITLRPGSSCMEIDGRLVNCTEDSNSMLFWANVATHANPDYQIVFPQNTEFAAYHAKSSICHWPICREPFTNVDAYTNGVDVSWWKNHTVGNSLFAWELPEGFIGGYDHGRDAGTMLVGNRHIVRGGKFWSWGPNSGWPTKILTDNAGHYVELMVGAYTDSQPDYTWMLPGETKTFKMFWYGVHGLKGIRKGNETFAVNMEKPAPDKLFLAAHATRRVEKAQIEVKTRGEGEQRIVFSKIIPIAPDKPWATTINVPADVPETAYTMTVAEITPHPATVNLQPSTCLSYTPIRHDVSKPCPPEVKAPKRPKDIASTEECYYVGLRAEQFHQPYVDANDYFEEVLRRDPLDSRANTRLGIYWRRHWNLEKAERHLRTALVRQTKDYTRVKDGEAMYNLGLVLAEKGDAEGAIDALYRAAWTYEYNSPANLALARIYAAKGDWKMSLDRVDEAIAYNAHNLDAKCLKAMLLREGARRETRDAARAVLDDILAIDPLNACALYLTLSEADFIRFMRDEPESYLELALKFRENGFPDESRKVLEIIDARVAYPTVKLHLGKIDEFLSMPRGACNPFRRETKDLLEALAEETVADGESPGTDLKAAGRARLYLYLGDVWGNVDMDRAMAAWKNVLTQFSNSQIKQSNDSPLPYALRNLGSANWKHTRDFAAALDCYRRAIDAKPDEAFFLEEFDHVAEEAKLPVAERYAMLKDHHATATKRAGALIAECVTGTACGDYDRVLGFMRTAYLPTFEGAANFHDTYLDALTGKASQLEAKGDHAGALKLYDECFEFPKNQQVFVYDKRRPRDAQIWYRIGEAMKRLGIKTARECFEKAAAVDTLRTDYCYEKALALIKLGRMAEAKAIGEAMVTKGSVHWNDYVDFFDYEGNRYSSTLERKNAEAAKTKELGERILKQLAYTQLQRIWAVEPERIEAAVKAYPAAFGDGFILSAFPETLTIGPPACKDFATQKAFVERFQKAGLPVQICVSSTIGHRDDWTLPGDYPTMVGSKGQVAKAMACPRSEKFKAFLCERFARYAALHPTVLWLDDDFRMPHHPPVDFACFCDGCVAKFNVRTGLRLDRAALVKAILADDTLDGIGVRDAFAAFSTDALNDLVKAVAEAVHAVDADVALGFMAINPNGAAYGERDLATWRERGRNAKGEVWFRPGSGAYTDAEPLAFGGIVAKNVQIARFVAATEGPGVVNVAEEVTCPYNRRAKSMRMTFFECALNVGLAGCDGTTFDAIKPNLAEQLGKGAIVDMLNGRRGELARMRNLIRGKRQIGVAVPPYRAKRGPVKTMGALIERNGIDRTVLDALCAGVPLTFRSANACQTLARLDRAKLPARIDAPTRMGLSLWEATNGTERIGFVWNFGADEIADARLVLDAEALVERMEPDGTWAAIGCGKEMTLPAIEGWNVGIFRIRRKVRPRRRS